MEEMVSILLVINFTSQAYRCEQEWKLFLNSKYDQGKIKLCLFLALVCRYVNKNHYRHAISLEEIWELEFYSHTQKTGTHTYTDIQTLSFHVHERHQKEETGCQGKTFISHPQLGDLGPCQQLGAAFWLATPVIWPPVTSLCNNAAQTERKYR